MQCDRGSMRWFKGGFVLAGMLLSVVPGAEAQAISEPLLKSTQSWDGVDLPVYPGGQPEVTVLRIYIPPHSTLDWHYHPVINAAYVLTGELTVERRVDGKSEVVRAGQALPEMVGKAHRGFTAGQSATLIVFYAGIQGQPITVPIASEPVRP